MTRNDLEKLSIKELEQKAKDEEALTNAEFRQHQDTLKDPNASISEKEEATKQINKMKCRNEDQSIKDVKWDGNGNLVPAVRKKKGEKTQ